MRRTGLILLLAVLTGCGRSAVTSAPSPSPSISDAGSSESAQPEGTFTPLPRPTHPARPSTPPATFVAMVDSGDIVVAETATGQIVRTVVARNDRNGTVDALSVAPGGATLYFSTTVGHDDCAVWSVPMRGGTPKRIATGSTPSVSPDGRWLAFTRRCGATKTTLVVRDLRTGTDRSWKDENEMPADGVLDWAPDSRTMYLIQCGADTCGPVAVDTTQPGTTIDYGKQPQPEELDGRLYGWVPVTRRDHFVFTVDYGDIGGDERFPMLELDPATGRIIAAIYDDGREFRPQDFDRSGEHMLVHKGDTLNRWSAGNLFPLGDGFLSVRWIE